MSDVVGLPTLQDLGERQRPISMFPVKMSAACSEPPDAFKKGLLTKRINRQRSRRDANIIWTTKKFPQMLTVA